MKVSAEMQSLAEQAWHNNRPIEQTATYDVYPLSPGFMDHFVLWLWHAGCDFPPGREPEGFELPVLVDGRPGYLMEKTRSEIYKKSL